MLQHLLFADDTSIFYSHSNPNTLESVLNNELKNIEVWLQITAEYKENDLSLFQTLAEEM